MKIVRNSIIVILIVLVGYLPLTQVVSAQEPVVRAVLLYSPTCAHCLDVINEILPALVEKYGTSQLQIFGVSTYTEIGSTLFQNTAETFNTPEDRQAVPTMIIGNQVLVGSGEIAELFPALIEQGLSNGGVDWPVIPGLEEALATNGTGTEESTPTVSYEYTLRDKFTSDLAGNSLAVIVLIGMLGAVIYSGVNLWNRVQSEINLAPEWLIPLFSLIGIGIAGYLSFVEVNQIEAVCGPVGNCNTVQQSSYATLFGLIPIGFLGILGYLSIIILWLVDKLNLPEVKQYIRIAFWIVTLGGTLFSIYLTFLEPFVIGATCMWCLSSAILMTILYIMATRRLSFNPELE